MAQWTTWTAANGSTGGVSGCEIGDKIFQNFVVTTAPPNDTSVQFTTSALPGGIFAFTINFINSGVGALNAPFVVGYNVAVDPTLNPDGSAISPNSSWKINRVASGLQDQNGNASASLSKNCGTGCLATTTALGGVVTTVVANITPVTTLDVVDTYAYTSGVVSGVGNTYQQVNTVVPEPSTFVLLGGAMVGLGLLRRRPRKG